MDENLDEFNLNREEILESLSSEIDLFLTNFSFPLLQNQNFFDPAIIKILNRSFLELIFKSITYKDPPKKEEVPPPNTNIEQSNENPVPEEEKNEPKNTENEEEKKAQEDVNPNSNVLVEQQNDEPISVKEYPPRPEPNQHDFDMIKGKSKIKVLFEGLEIESEEGVKFNGIIRINLPLNYNAPREEEKNPEENQIDSGGDPNEEVKEETKIVEKPVENIENPNPVSAEPVNEESFIEPYDGTTFQKLKEQYYGKNNFIVMHTFFISRI